MKNIIILAVLCCSQSAPAQQPQQFTNDLHKYTLSYPADWYIGPGATQSKMIFLYKKFPTNAEPNAEIKVEIDTIKGSATEGEFFTANFLFVADQIKRGYRKSDIQQQDSLLLEGNHPSLLFQWTDKLLGTDHYALFRTLRQRKIYSIYFHQYGSGSQGKIIADAVKTIASFRLLPLSEELKTVKEPAQFAENTTQPSEAFANSRNYNQNQQKGANTKEKNSSPKRAVGKITGGGFATYDLLGRQLLLALKTNNVTLWKQCIHPTYGTDKDPDAFKNTTAQLQRIREILLPLGLSDWRKVTFSRILANQCNSCAKPGEQWLTDMQIEAWYQGKEFLMKIDFSPVFTDGRKWFMGGFYVADMNRAGR